MEKENAIRTRYRREQRLSKLLADDTQAKKGVEYHPFNTLFQLTCKFIRSHEPLTLKPNQGSVNAISQNKDTEESVKTSGEIAVVQENYAPKPQPQPATARPDRPQPNTGCYGCGSPEHFVRNCPSVAPCPNCGRKGHNLADCWGPNPNRNTGLNAPQNPNYQNNGARPYNARNQGYNAQGYNLSLIHI